MLFATLHIYWALGGAVGLATSAGADLATTRPLWFVLVGLWGVALVLMAGAAFALVLTRHQLRGTLQRAAQLLGWTIAILLLARGFGVEALLLVGASGVALSVGDAQTYWSLVLWNPWFIAGGLAFALATAQHRLAGRD